MSIINKFKSGEITAGELRDMAAKDPALRAELSSFLDEELSDDELMGVAAAGAWLKGTNADDFIVGGDGRDRLYGGGGEDVLMGGDGSDTLDGGFRDNASDVLMGGDGNDVAIWGPSKDGSDFFDGGDGYDLLKVDLTATGHDSIQAALEGGYLTLSIAGDPDFVPAFDENGNLVLPEGVSGQITGPTGESMTFTDVEKIGKY